jgi:uncharacterized protein
MPRTAYQLITVACILIIALTSTSCGRTSIDQRKPTTLTISTGIREGYTYKLAAALAKALSSSPDKYVVKLQPTGGAIGSVASIQAANSDCGFTNANIAYEAYAGRLPDDSRKYDRLRGAALVQTVPLNLFVPRDSPVHRLRDLRGRTVGIGTAEGGTYRLAMLVLAADGLGRDSVQINDDSFADSLPLLVRGKLDALFLLSSQSSDITTRVTGNRLDIVPLDGPEMERLRQEYPFVRPALITAGTYTGQTEPLRTIGVDTLIICRADLATEHVREVTKAWFKTATDLLESGSLAEAVSPELASATPIPLHEGAASYYRSRRLAQ